MVFYRKYRSQTIDELDSREVREKLTAILQKNIPHAFLFTGPKGLGKTSTARIVAKVVNCTRRAVNNEPRTKNQEQKGKVHSSPSIVQSVEDVEPCNVCASCVSITNGTNMDVLEIDAASNRGIDEIRDLKDKIRLAPLSSLMKVYIIDEVHMLTTEAFNALLKTLEEPPSHAMFILCTTESHKVPTTILSRSFHISFHLATKDELIRSFKRIVVGEKLAVTDDALVEIAQLSDGGFRDGAKIFEELVALAGGKEITKGFVQETYQIRGISTYREQLLLAFVTRNITDGLSVVSALTQQGTDMKYFIQTMIEVLHTEFLKRNGVSDLSIVDEKVAEKLSSSDLLSLLRLFMQVQSELKNAVIPQLPLELALVEWCGENEGVIKGASSAVKESAEMVTVSTSTTEVSVTSLRKQVGNIAKIKALYGEPKESESKEPEIIIKTTDLTTMHIANNKEITKEWLGEFWNCLISEMKQHNHTLAGLLRGCMIRSFDRKDLIIETSFTFHKEKLDDHKTKQILEQICSALTGIPIVVSIELKNK